MPNLRNETPYGWETHNHNEDDIVLGFLVICAITMPFVLVAWFGKQYVVSLTAYLTGYSNPHVDAQRALFNSLNVQPLKPVQNHTHASAAAERSSATNFLDAYCFALGEEPYFYQRSRADERHNRAGSRTWFWAKDFNVEPVQDESRFHYTCIVDTDYYMDMPSFLVGRDKPTLLYTYQPSTAAGSYGDFAFTWNERNEVVYRICGGSAYTHPVWNYSSDHFVVTDWSCWPTTTAYLVDRRPAGPHHEYVLLTPVTSWYGPYAFLIGWFSYNVLTRFTPVKNGFIRMTTLSKDGLKTSTAVVGQYVSATVDTAIDNTITNQARISKHELTAPAVASNLGPASSDPKVLSERNMAAYILVAYHRANPTPHAEYTAPIVPTVPLEEGVKRYQFGAYDENAKPSMVPFMTPFVDACYAPDRSLGNEQRAVKARIVDVKSESGLDSFLIQVVKEFVQKLLPLAHLLQAVDVDQVYDKQDRPTQRSILDEACVTGNPKRIAKVFIKAEAYAKPADPRIITTYNGVDKLAYSRYIYPLADYLKRFDWYGFGHVPRDLSIRVAQICVASSYVVKSDFSRLDGTITESLRYLERCVLLRAFDREETPKLVELHRAQYNLRAISRQGVSYNTGTARGSGSPETSVFNSIVNAFCTFLAHRMTRVNGAFRDADAAWKALERGIHAGDDGLNPDIDCNSYQKAAQRLGLNLKIEPVQRGQYGVEFLARVYGPGVWIGDPSSVSNLPRQLSKFHATTVLPANVTPAEKLIDKSISFYHTDSNTPIIGPFVRKVLEVSGVDPSIAPRLQLRWLDRFSLFAQYHNEPGEWMARYAELSLPEFNLVAFHKWLDGANTIEELLKPPCFMPAQRMLAAVPVVVQKELILPAGQDASKPSTRNEKQRARKKAWKESKKSVKA